MESRLHLTCVDTPIGNLVLQADDEGLFAIDFMDRPLSRRRQRENETLRQAKRELEAYFAGELEEFTIRLALRKSGFQTKVLEAVRAIPFGETRSYSEIAHSIGAPRAVRAVGGANARNCLPIVVPCHRVVGASGDLTGYAGGLERKAWLLRHEAAPVMV